MRFRVRKNWLGQCILQEKNVVKYEKLNGYWEPVEDWVDVPFHAVPMLFLDFNPFNRHDDNA